MRWSKDFRIHFRRRHGTEAAHEVRTKGTVARFGIAAEQDSRSVRRVETVDDDLAVGKAGSDSIGRSAGQEVDVPRPILLCAARDELRGKPADSQAPFEVPNQLPAVFAAS